MSQTLVLLWFVLTSRVINFNFCQLLKSVYKFTHKIQESFVDVSSEVPTDLLGLHLETLHVIPSLV